MTDVATVARGLSEAQRRAVRNAEEIVRGEMNVHCPDDVLDDLVIDDLVDFNGDALTPLGLAVRSHLLGEALTSTPVDETKL